VAVLNLWRADWTADVNPDELEMRSETRSLSGQLVAAGGPSLRERLSEIEMYFGLVPDRDEPRAWAALNDLWAEQVRQRRAPWRPGARSSWPRRRSVPPPR
jgi:hypothetical protein